jgi:hypothetical protein
MKAFIRRKALRFSALPITEPIPFTVRAELVEASAPFDKLRVNGLKT